MVGGGEVGKSVPQLTYQDGRWLSTGSDQNLGLPQKLGPCLSPSLRVVFAFTLRPAGERRLYSEERNIITMKLGSSKEVGEGVVV